MVKICHDKLIQPHSVLHYDDNKMFYCVSGEFLVKCLGYTHGLAVRKQTMFVGQSESRQIPVLLNKHTNILLDCGNYVHDISTKLSSFIHIPSEENYGILVI
ncbi:hypothetical protein [Peribacillus frigoritolerans]|uniref:hypothetical protein n=1 Tax=Peribacillus frigoritolerans TaxID=450367 RepID=UPI0038238F3F